MSSLNYLCILHKLIWDDLLHTFIKPCLPRAWLIFICWGPVWIFQITGQWKAGTAGGCSNYPDTHKNNPIYQVKIDNNSTDNFMLVELSGPKWVVLSSSYIVMKIIKKTNIVFSSNYTHYTLQFHYFPDYWIHGSRSGYPDCYITSQIMNAYLYVCFYIVWQSQNTLFTYLIALCVVSIWYTLVLKNIVQCKYFQMHMIKYIIQGLNHAILVWFLVCCKDYIMWYLCDFWWFTGSTVWDLRWWQLVRTSHVALPR